VTGETEDLPVPRANAAPGSLLDSYRSSLRLQEMRIEALEQALRERRLRVAGLEKSMSWRLTGPLRLATSIARGRLPSGLRLADVARRAGDILRHEGSAGLRRRLAWRLNQRRLRQAPHAAADDAAPWSKPAGLPRAIGRSALIIAELSVPQCAKYRVWQKQEHFHRLGWRCTVVDWHDTPEALSALQTCACVIFYRVPSGETFDRMVREARRVGLQPWWEVDDLIFDEPLYRQNSNLATLPRRLREELIDGVRRYRQAMLDCGHAIASTPVLARCMTEAGVAEVGCIENALDRETLDLAARLRTRRAALAAAARPGDRSGPTIVYGSGTRTHDSDFALAAGAIARLMRRHPDVRLRIIGPLGLPKELDPLSERIEALPASSYPVYMGQLAEGDIAIAPLEPTLFNDAKSNIKFLEAAILGMPCVCSPRAAFRDAVEHDSNGLFAEGEAAWEGELERLIAEPALRHRLGQRALSDVQARYAPAQVARLQLQPLLARLAPSPARPPAAQASEPQRTSNEPAPAQPPTGDPPTSGAPLRVLVANVFFSPRSFGGATLVAEALSARLAARGDVELSVFTSRPDDPSDPDDAEGGLRRYDWQPPGSAAAPVPVFAVGLPPAGDHVATFDNPVASRHFARVLDAVRPDVVHAHSVQGFGAGILRLCQERGIPYVITLHDAWWLCDRQFMVQGNGRYCFQTRIDLRVCQSCVPQARHLEARSAILHQVLMGAAHLLSPSPSHAALYIANDVDPARISVNRNGITRPSGSPRLARPAGSPLRFGFVGGNEVVKGFHLVRAAFEAQASRAWELVLVDNTLNLGFSSIEVSDWKVAGRIRVVPAYRADGLDAFLGQIDVLLFPSQWKESYGLTVREALARDVWVIATAPGGQADDIEDGVNGRLIPLDAGHEPLARAIGELLDMPDRLAAYRNPHGGSLATHDGQVAELLDVLRRAAGTGPAVLPLAAEQGAQGGEPAAGQRQVEQAHLQAGADTA